MPSKTRKLLSGRNKDNSPRGTRKRPVVVPPKRYIAPPIIPGPDSVSAPGRVIAPPPIPAPTSSAAVPTASAAVPAPIRVMPPAAVAAPVTDADRILAAQKVVDIVENTALPPPTIVNPESKFVIATYWWGRGNMNNNVKHPCAAYEKEAINELTKEVADYDYIKKMENDEDRLAEIKAEVESGISKSREKKVQDVAKSLEISEDEARKRLYTETPALKFEAMIARFEEDCKKVNCNYLTMEYPFDRPLYQAAINGKPVFIKKAIEACKGKGPGGTDLAVVYIDGDMRANVYPAIFDMDGIDFMARGWNIDPRSSKKYRENKVCFDPYIFETSGGIQYFANTPASLDLLDTWTLSNLANPGKADDRVISLAFNVFKYQCPLAYIQLPIEYLWLTDLYYWQDPKNTSVEKSVIEHPECLTAEDSAEGASANRVPDHYTFLIEGSTHCERLGGKFYEYIFFPKKELRSTLGPYLDYLSTAKNADDGFLFEVVPFDDKYGRHQAVADKNLADAETASEVPTTFDVPKILAQLKKGVDVTIGSDPKIEELKQQPLEFIAYNKSTKSGKATDDDHTLDTANPDLKPEFDMSKGMFFSAKNPVLYHILAMCEKPEDLTTIFNESYTFLARVRCYWLK